MRSPILFAALLLVPVATFAETPADQGAAPKQIRTAAHFKKIDADGNGTLSREEIEKGMPRLVKDFDAIDTNKDGQVSHDELRAYMRGKAQAIKQKGAERFRQADTDGDGSLSKEEAEKGMPRLAKDFDAIDANQDGKLSQDEIRTYMRSKVESRRGGGMAPGAPAVPQ